MKKIPRKTSRTLEEQEQHLSLKLKNLQIKKQIRDLRDQMRGKPTKK
jgi:hypothetical protein